ncbi:MAG: hypothetical protein H7X92_08655 [Chitinophagales bacterium]|nr:hypothetical protein [Hyphomicrobiales bacterium]
MIRHLKLLLISVRKLAAVAVAVVSEAAVVVSAVVVGTVVVSGAVATAIAADIVVAGVAHASTSTRPIMVVVAGGVMDAVTAAINMRFMH